MSKLCEIGYIKELLRRHGFGFSKALGQNFLCAPHVPVTIAENANIDSETSVIEVGPGIGTLSYELCSRAKQVVAIELDKRLPDILKETMAEYDNFSIVQGDVLKVDINEIVRENFGDGKVVACANLPYYITTPAISALIEAGCFKSITVMVQREVAKRICSKENTADYGAFTVYVNYYTKPKIVLDVPAGCFIPAPKVDSAVVRMDILDEPSVKVRDEKLFFQVVKAAFAQRRKQLVNCINMAFPAVSKDMCGKMLTEMGLSATIRGEALSVEQLGQLSDKIYEVING
ncbi:MAG: 16S rRNA (adenine(1518)-N(6)/adenine(1519)-N(6))-dimethyltransferase RsmA [Ruminococcaceae bacterium]|nr:16S rRNA (adenine(1518)-N(6)/adenine(1519)-N(6))-dimethyltransferase RsmA [Oscillospiraceae bacterium]